MSLKVYDVRGREIRTVVGDFQEPGTYPAVFEATDLPRGVYFCELHVGEGLVATKKMLLVQ